MQQIFTGLVFLTLGAIYLLMTLLVRFLPPKNAPAVAQKSTSSPVPEHQNGEKVAAVSVALARALADESVALPTPAAEASDRASGWVAAGRNRQLTHPQSREKKP